MIVSTKDSKDFFSKLILVPKAVGKPTRVPVSMNLTYNVNINPGYPIFIIPNPFYVHTLTQNLYTGMLVSDMTRFLLKFSTSIIKVIFFGIVDLEKYLNTYGPYLNFLRLIDSSYFVFYSGLIHEKLDLRVPPFNFPRFLTKIGYHTSDIVTNLLASSPTFGKLFRVPNLKAINLQAVLVIFTHFYPSSTREIITITEYGYYLPVIRDIRMKPDVAKQFYENFINYFTQINI
jgi:hypothetical protein